MIDHGKLKIFEKWFYQYTTSFQTDKPLLQRNYDLKIDHSLRVREGIREIGKGMNLSPVQYFLADTGALFHDAPPNACRARAMSSPLLGCELVANSNR